MFTSEHLVAEINALPVNSRLLNAGVTVAFKLSGEMMEGIKSFDQINPEKTLSSTALIQKINHPRMIYLLNQCR